MTEPGMHQRVPLPDPTDLTTAQLEAALKGLRDYVDGQVEVLTTKLIDNERARRLLHESAGEIPQAAIAKLEAVMDERFSSIVTQFKERDTRQERESRDNKVAVDAAFAAQKEAAAKQDEGNAKSIDKSEKATAETIKTNQELAKSTTDSLTKGLDELKLKVTAIEAIKLGGKEQTTSLYAFVGFVAALLAILAVLVASGAFGQKQVEPKIVNVPPMTTTP